VSISDKLKSFLDQPKDCKLESTLSDLERIRSTFLELHRIEKKDFVCWAKDQSPIPKETLIKRYTSGHTVFYNLKGRRFLMIDPDQNILHECEWEQINGKTKLTRARIQLDCRQWVGILPENKSFSTDIDVSTQPGWEKMTLDDLRQGASQVWNVPFEEVKYFYKDENFQSKGDGRYHIELKKDSLFALDQGSFDKTLFISFMFAVDWGRIDLIPVVELFQSTLPGTGGAVFEFIWGLYEDQCREEQLPPLRYRGLPTYPSMESFNIFSAFFTPQGPDNEKIFEVFINPDRSHEITWTPKENPPLRFFNSEHKITLTVQNGFLYKVSVWDDPLGIPFINRARGDKVSCQREVRVEKEQIVLIDNQIKQEIPLNPQWAIIADGSPVPSLPANPLDWRHFFGNLPPKTDPAKILFTAAFYPEGNMEISEASVQPLAMDQIIQYMEESPDMPEKLKKVENVLIHTLDTVIAGCVDSSHKRDYTVLYSDPEFAVKNAQSIWNHAASRNELDNLKQVCFISEAERVNEAYQKQYDLIFKWIPFMFFQDRENCEAMFKATANALQPDGILFLIGPYPIKGLFDHYGLDLRHGDPIIDMPYFKQHLKMCPENHINDIVSVFMLEKKRD
tara:strand:+ start:2860 stop:4722 length:1863 start_codon:yes stop_codon:yes gene_type:complete